ncbi:RNA polymerase subunit sigma-24 [Clostridium thermosuccinogenes]|uniref:RNA polymerase subunit sigma-24 n=1 Tax=Clostridium thermosuccinogenes TaxID=84032 RepID=A0A2K2FJ15_9CLOT|nr:sigma-70 family RNA polymerase sigma factor [Pseudoclostridium thermosuccinogenes]AUS98714.1 RNA polymerase subunit sigma-24 [Pseudoclostridium thermosuccinogenes]PNT94417.1 RNA polymerase subunit sigma-24 [Pseudoclostridium thermosuccinogenes]PNT98781.1 RNA polymerase subunit sigma-24 [Pseudoclostridium thermosuccinogenes]PNU00784.1 RNA polymerase subunit sigma-24 [Pseudoclostridium thermosuccinogenes]
MSDREKDLLKKARNGDIEAFEQLIEDYQKRVFNIALRMIGNYDDANELAQEVFIRIFKSIKDFKEESSLSTWIYRITTNVCLDEIRKRKNKNVVSLDEEVKLEEGDLQRQVEDTRPTPDVIAEKNEVRKLVKDAIMSLPEEQRTVIILRDIQGFSYEEIAKIMKCPEGTVKSRINRSRQILRDRLKPKMELLKGDYVK